MLRVATSFSKSVRITSYNVCYTKLLRAVLDIQNIIKQLIELDMGILITDHNVRETLGICDRAYVMRSGEMLASGTSKEIANDPNVRKYYLGEHFTF